VSINEYLILAIGAVVLILIYYIFSREAQQNRQIRVVASAIEQLNHQIFALEQNLKQQLAAIEADNKDILTPDDLRYELEVGVSEYSKPVQEQLSALQEDFNITKDQMQQRINSLEENIRSLSLPSSVTGLDDERITLLYKQGVDVDTISKELRLSKAEVEFVLKINELK